MTLLERLRSQFPEASGRSLKLWLTRGRIEVNGRVVREGRSPVQPTDRVSLGSHRPSPFPAGLRLVHEDEQLLVIDKPPGLLTVATQDERSPTAYRMLWEYLGAQRPPRRPFVVHRLDRETSGLLVFATSVAAKRHLQSQFESRDVERLYVAVVEGRVGGDEGVLVDRLVQDEGLRVRPGRGGRLAITRYRVRRRSHDTTVLDLSLGTGRRHQIRVQLAAHGHPVVGDTRHGSRRDPFGRLGLHATRLGFVHPTTGARVSFESRPPAAWV